MNIKRLIDIEAVIFFVLAAGVGLVFAFYMVPKPEYAQKVALPISPVANDVINTPTPIPTSVPFFEQTAIDSPTPKQSAIVSIIPPPQTIIQISPDGTKQLVLTITSNKDLSKTYDFATEDSDGSNKQPIYRETYDSGSMGIPFNAWSPDDKYVFIDRASSSGNESIVLRADGSAISQQDANIDTLTVFANQNTGNVYDEVTGWAADNLLILNSKTSNGKKGPSYWIEVPSGALIPLSTQF